MKSESEVAQSCPTLRGPTDCSLPGSSAHGIFQARGLEWVPLRSLEMRGRMEPNARLWEADQKTFSLPKGWGVGWLWKH